MKEQIYQTLLVGAMQDYLSDKSNLPDPSSPRFDAMVDAAIRHVAALRVLCDKMAEEAAIGMEDSCCYRDPFACTDPTPEPIDFDDFDPAVPVNVEGRPIVEMSDAALDIERVGDGSSN